MASPQPVSPLTARPPDLPAAVRVPVELLFAGLAFVLRRPAFHTRGVAVAGTLRPQGVGATLLPFTGGGPRVVVGRLSKSVGLPSGVPDLYGLGVRIPDAYGSGRHQDLVVTTCGRSRRTRRVLAPARGFDRRPYSSVLAYDTGAGRVLLGASYAGPARSTPLRLDEVAGVAARGELRFLLGVAPLDGRWRTFGVVAFDRVLPADEAAALALNPWNTAASLRPAGVVNALRHPAYVGSQRARPGPTGRGVR